jgi:hypothetical protein
MKAVLVVGMNKTGTTIVASVIQKSMDGAHLYVEPQRVAFFEKGGRTGFPLVVKILYEHWMERPSLLSGILRGETGFRPDKTVAIIRDPRDALISALMYGAYERVVDGASKAQVDEWVRVVREKESNPESHSVLGLLESFNRIFNVRYPPDWFFENFVRYSAWLAENRDCLYVLNYEDFVSGNIGELSRYLGLGLSDSRDVDPDFKRVTRTRGSGEWRRMMLPEDVVCWRERFGAALQTHGYSDWEILPERTDPAGGSEYILRITEDAFTSREPKPARPPIQAWTSSDQLGHIPVRRP